MPNNRLITKEKIAAYASVLLDAANTSGGQDAVLEVREQAEKIVSVMRTNVDLSGALEDAAYTPEQRAQIARAAFAQCNPAFTEVLAVMAERGEIKLLPQVRASYENQVETKLNLCILDVTTVVELDDHLRDIIKQKAESELGMKVVLRERIDKSILGGIIMSAGDQAHRRERG